MMKRMMMVSSAATLHVLSSLEIVLFSMPFSFSFSCPSWTFSSFHHQSRSCHWRTRCFFFLICRRAWRQRSQSPIIVTVRIDKHFKLYNDWSLSGKSKSSQLASQVMESTSKILLIAQSAMRIAATVQSSNSKSATTHDCKNLQIWRLLKVATNSTCMRDFTCPQPQCHLYNNWPAKQRPSTPPPNSRTAPTPKPTDTSLIVRCTATLWVARTNLNRHHQQSAL